MFNNRCEGKTTNVDVLFEQLQAREIDEIVRQRKHRKFQVDECFWAD